MVRILLSFIAILSLSGCFGTQRPAPITHYGTSDGEGSRGVHNVIAGDTLYSISKRYKVSMRDIVYANDLEAPFTLSVAQRLKLPPPREYKVRAGDSLFRVARMFQVSRHEVARLNGLQSPYVLYEGQRLTLPSANPAVMQSDAIVAQDVSIKAVPRLAAANPASVEGQELGAIPAPANKAAQGGKGIKAPARKAKITARTPARSSSKFMRPVKGRVVSRYGPKKGGLHNDGVNIAAPKGTPVAAAENGVVVYVGSELKGSGNLVLLRHSNRWMSAYAHLDKTTVTRGQVIKRGMKIGTVGQTGSVSTPQLHFEIRRGTNALNPEKYM